MCNILKPIEIMYHQTHPPRPCPPRNPHCGDTPGLPTVPSLIPLFMMAIILGVFMTRKLNTIKIN